MIKNVGAYVVKNRLIELYAIIKSRKHYYQLT